MELFTREEAFSVLRSKFKLEHSKERMKSDRRALLDEIVVGFHELIPFQNLRLLSVSLKDRRGLTLEEIKSDFLANIGGVCYNTNMCGYFLFKAIGFDVTMAYCNVTSKVRCEENHVVLYVENVETPGDRFLVDLALGYPTFQAIDLDFEKESPIYISSYLEYKYVKHDGKILRMHRKGDLYANPDREQVPGVDFWMDGFRRFHEVELQGSTDVQDFQRVSHEVFVNPLISPFHTSHRFILFKGKKASIVYNGKTLIENDKGELESKVIPGGDSGIVSAIQKLSPNFPEDLIRKSLNNWRQCQENGRAHADD